MFAGLRHANVIPFVGVCLDPGEGRGRAGRKGSIAIAARGYTHTDTPTHTHRSPKQPHKASPRLRLRMTAVRRRPRPGVHMARLVKGGAMTHADRVRPDHIRVGVRRRCHGDAPTTR